MNSTEKLEENLRGLRPCRPSPAIRQRLFDPAPAGRRARAAVAGVSRLQLWLAPLTGMALLLLSLATAWSPGPVRDEAEWPGPALSRAWETRVAQVARNAPPPPRFRSTNAGAVAPSFASLLLRQTNVFAR